MDTPETRAAACVAQTADSGGPRSEWLRQYFLRTIREVIAQARAEQREHDAVLAENYSRGIGTEIAARIRAGGKP